MGLKRVCSEWGSTPPIYRPPFGLKFPFWPSFCLLPTTSIHRCEALDVSFSMALESSRLDLCSSSYDQISDKSSLSPLLILAPFAFLGHFQSNSNISIPETFEQSHQVDPPSQGVAAAIDDVLVTPPDSGIEVVEATSTEEELIRREMSESITNLVVETHVDKGVIGQQESVIEELTHRYWESNNDPKENVLTDKEVQEEMNRNIMIMAKMAVAQSEMDPLPSFELGFDFGSQSQSQSQPEKEKEPEQETEKLDQDVQKLKSTEIQQYLQ
ncbi:hypothetical protein PIB30_068518 [Stylosanthes scabra]|uniref:Uncharacterized protein n=1 Tax=Stylosanthes scabra TaxID=79078 RepID=A0ABU6RP26_9FABA|nr:hypothetical protein [Stylosanthes scabra]